MERSATPTNVVAAIEAEIRGLDTPNVPSLRSIRRDYSRQLQHMDGEFVLAVARELSTREDHSWVALELICYHEHALSLISDTHLAEFGSRMDSWGTVDAFAGYLAGPAWIRGQITDELVCSWTKSSNRWWRRAALVSTVVLNTPSHGGTGDVARTLKVCELLVGDRDDMVVKAMSWALRKLVAVDREALMRFMEQHDGSLAARVKREVKNKLISGRKNPRR